MARKHPRADVSRNVLIALALRLEYHWHMPKIGGCINCGAVGHGVATCPEPLRWIIAPQAEGRQVTLSADPTPKLPETVARSKPKPKPKPKRINPARIVAPPGECIYCDRRRFHARAILAEQRANAKQGKE